MLLHEVVLDRVRSQVIDGVVSVCPADILTIWCVPSTWQSFDDQYVSEPLVIVSTCCDEPRSMLQAAVDVFVIDMEIFGCSSEV